MTAAVDRPPSWRGRHRRAAYLLVAALTGAAVALLLGVLLGGHEPLHLIPAFGNVAVAAFWTWPPGRPAGGSGVPDP